MTFYVLDRSPRALSVLSFSEAAAHTSEAVHADHSAVDTLVQDDLVLFSGAFLQVHTERVRLQTRAARQRTQGDRANVTKEKSSTCKGRSTGTASEANRLSHGTD